jgi:hypothetical protein
VGEVSNAYKILVDTPERKRPYGKTDFKIILK